VSFVVDRLRVHASLRRPLHIDHSLPAALLIAGSGPTDRNGASALAPSSFPTLAAVAGWLAADQVITLRYDKLGTGATGLGP